MISVKRSHLLAAVAALTLVFFMGAGSENAQARDELITEKNRELLLEEFRDLTGHVQMVMFTQELECQYCSQTRQLLAELASLSDKLDLAVFDFVQDREEAARYGVDKIPATVLMGAGDVGIKYYGVPGGYELAALVATIKDLSSGSAGLGDELSEILRTLDKDVHIQVFVTPTCPYCPPAVRTAYRLAQENEHIRADAVEAVEFPHLANKYGVRGVPMVIINETISFVGAQSELFFVEKILSAVEQTRQEEERKR